MKRCVEGVELDLEGLFLLPGLINAHDHLDFALFPRLGRGPYPNATAWAKDIYHPATSPIAEHLQIPMPVRLLWGGLRNLLAGVTTVSHHNPYDPTFDENFPVRVVKNYGWAHSLAFDDVRAKFDATPPGAPFLIHAAEGTDAASAAEVFELDHLGLLNDRTVLIHAVGVDDAGWQVVRARRASVVVCPRSNAFTLGLTAKVPADIPVALGTDSPLTAEGDFLDELDGFSETHQAAAAKILRLQPTGDYIATPAFGQQPQLVVIADRIHLICPRLATALPAPLRAEFFLLQIECREPVLVRWNIPRLIAQTRFDTIRLAGRLVMQ